MITLAISEHLEKIPYLLSLYLPTALFFLGGLALAWFIWYKHARRLNLAIAKHNRLSKDLSAGYQKKHDLGSRFSGLFEAHKKHWDSELSARDGKITSLNNDLSAEAARFSELDLSYNNHKKQAQANLDERESKLGLLQGDLTKNVSALGLLQTKHDDDTSANNQLRGKVTDLEAELSKLKSAPSKPDVSSEELARLRDEANAAKAAQKKAEDELANAANAAKNTPAPAGAQAFFANSGATKDARLGYLYQNRPSHKDDLTEISGVGDTLQPKLNDIGVYQFKQVALWSQDNIDNFSEKLSFNGRVEREQWVNQATDLHREKHGESLAPIVNIYHKAAPAPKADPPVQKTEPAPAPAAFKDQPVKVDEKFGVLFTSRPSEIDDLKKIKGVANVLEAKLHEIGLYRFKQIAMWTDQQAADFSDKLAFPGRVERDEWVKQATAFHAEKYGNS